MPTSEPLDFSGLTDDQIVELATALAREAMSRNPALQAAFRQSLLDEQERIAAAARGSERVRRDEASRIEQQAARAEAARHAERERRRVHDAMAAYLRAGADIIGKPADAITLVWTRSGFGRGKGPHLQLNLGQTGELASWHLVDYVAQQDRIYTSPGLHDKQAQLLPWCREVCAAVNALGITRTIIIKGIEL